ncbi:Inhibitor of growth protein 5 [Phlyctochytrium bullatum]|nr:Inhibitor of growth protein 5 [Phlyctochytrium bullatum]
MVKDICHQLEEETSDFLGAVSDLSGEEKVQKIKALTKIFKDYLKHGEDKVTLAIQTYELVDKHIRRLDEDLSKYEEEQMTGPRVAIASHNSLHKEDSRTRSGASNIGAGAGGLEGRGAAGGGNVGLSSHASHAGGPSGLALKHGEKRGSERKTKDRDRNEKLPPPEPIKESTPQKVKSGKNTVTAGKNQGNQKKGDKKKNDAGKSGSKANSQDMAIDPNEPRYCICQQVSFGEMIAVCFEWLLPFAFILVTNVKPYIWQKCDGDNCEFEWFHYQCK